MMWEQIKKEAVKKDGKNKVDDIVNDIQLSRVYFGSVLQSTTITGYMEEYLYRGLEKLLDIEDQVRKL